MAAKTLTGHGGSREVGQTSVPGCGNATDQHPPAFVRDGGYQTLPPLPAEVYAALKADIAANGILVPVDVDENGNVLDGHNRTRIAEELGIRDYPTVVRPGLSEQDKRAFSRRANT